MVKLRILNRFESLVLGYKDNVIGKLSHDNGVSSEYYKNLDAETRLVLELDSKLAGKVIHLDYLTIDPDFRGRGYLKESIEEFELFAKDSKFEVVTLFSDKKFIRKYEKLGYSQMYYEGTFNYFLMLKKLA